MLGLQIAGVVYGTIWLGLSIRALTISQKDLISKFTKGELVRGKILSVVIFAIWPIVLTTLIYKGYQDAKRNSE